MYWSSRSANQWATLPARLPRRLLNCGIAQGPTAFIDGGCGRTIYLELEHLGDDCRPQFDGTAGLDEFETARRARGGVARKPQRQAALADPASHASRNANDEGVRRKAPVHDRTGSDHAELANGDPG